MQCSKMIKCRLCVCEMINEESISVFDKDALLEDIYHITTIQIQRNDTLTTICTFCNYKINEIREFKNKCLEAQEILRTEEESIRMNLIQMLDGNFSETEPSITTKYDDQTGIKQEVLIAIQNEEVLSNITYDDSDANSTNCDKESRNENIDLIEITSNEINSIDTTYGDSEDCLLGPYNQPKEKFNGAESPIKKKSKSSKEEGRLRYKALLRPCDQCGKLVEKNRLQAHQNQHLGIKPYSCNFENCGKSFYCAYVLTNHKRTHTDLNRHECEICGKKYNLQKSLYNHKQKHKTPSYCCTICERRYKNSTYLKQHMRTHTGERPYNCKQCDKAFASAYNLKAHLRSHTKEKPFQCQYCVAAYGYNNLLKAHMLSCHSDIKE